MEKLPSYQNRIKRFHKKDRLLLCPNCAGQNLIKEKFVSDNGQINMANYYFLTAITPDEVRTLGALDTRILGQPVQFKVIPMKFHYHTTEF